MLAGMPGVKPDRMVRRFHKGAPHEPSLALSSQNIVEIVTVAAGLLGVDLINQGSAHRPDGQVLDEVLPVARSPGKAQTPRLAKK